MAEMRRLKRQFIAMNKLRTVADIERIPAAFIEYLNANLE